MAVWSHVKVCIRWLSVQPRLYSCAVCDTTAPLQLRYAASGAIQVLYAFAFFIFNRASCVFVMCSLC